MITELYNCQPNSKYIGAASFLGLLSLMENSPLTNELTAIMKHKIDFCC
jgi:hypothetical protein